MISENSKTIRDFSLEAKTKTGEKIKIFFGYDMGSNNSGFYIYASVDGASEGTNKKTFEKIKSLKIPAIDKLVRAIGTDVTGAPYNYDLRANTLLDMYVISGDEKILRELKEIHRVDEIGATLALETYIKEYKILVNKNATKRELIAFKKRFNNSNRPFFLDLTKNVVTEIRQLCLNGIIVNRDLVKVVFEIDVDNFNENYYKRDVDLIRKAKMDLYKNVLRKKYKEN